MSKQERAVLGIESSCDDTGAAIVGYDGKILSNCIHSQLKLHLLNGGIIPAIARESHVNNIDQLARQTFVESGLSSVGKDIEAIAVTNRPGIGLSLQVGLNYARQLAAKYSKPLIPVHHMQAHALMPLLQNPSIRFPFLAVLLSGGHALITIAKRFNEFHLLGAAYDTAPGDVLDKLARRMKLRNFGPPYDGISGGAAVELMARREGADKFKYFNDERTIPMLQHKGCDMSFSAFHDFPTTMGPRIDELWATGDREVIQNEFSHMCASFQRAILIQVAKKLHRAVMYYRMFWRYDNEDAFVDKSDVQHVGFNIRQLDEENFLDVVVSGGVAANSYITSNLRTLCQECIDPNIGFYTPSKNLCSDNGLMIAWNGLLHRRSEGQHTSVLEADAMEKVEVTSNCPIGQDISSAVRGANFTLKTPNHPEFKVVKHEPASFVSTLQ